MSSEGRRSRLWANVMLVAWCWAAPPPGTAAEALPDLASRAGEDWGGFLGPTGNGRSGLEGMAVPWPAAGPRIVWHCDVGEGYCAPAVAAGRLLLFDRVGRDNRLRCLHAETGARLWEERYPTTYADTFGYDGGPRSAPVIAGDRVLTFGAEGRLECRDLVDGASLWRIDTAQKYHVVQNFFGVGSAPLVLDAGGRRLVVVPVGGSRPDAVPPAPERLDLVEGLDSGLVAFDLDNGRELWRASGELASYSTPLAARIAGRDVVLAWMRDHFLVVDPGAGQVLGRFRWRDDQVFSVVAASPVVRGTEVLLSECYGPGSVVLDLARLAAEGVPAVVRQDQPKSRPDGALKAHWATPVLHEDHVYGSSGRNSGDAGLVCVDWKTGGVAWSEAGFGRASLVLVGRHLVVLGEFGDLALVEATPARYVEVSRTRLVDPRVGAGAAAELLTPPCWAAPVVARGLLYVRGRSHLVCVDLLAGP